MLHGCPMTHGSPVAPSQLLAGFRPRPCSCSPFPAPRTLASRHHCHRHSPPQQPVLRMCSLVCTVHMLGTLVPPTHTAIPPPAEAVSTGTPTVAVAQGASVAEAGETVITECNVFAKVHTCNLQRACLLYGGEAGPVLATKARALSQMLHALPHAGFTRASVLSCH